MMQIEYGPKVKGTPVDNQYCSNHRNGVICPHEKHITYAPDRLLREGNRVTVAIARQDRNNPWYVTEIRCLHCPLSTDIQKTIIDWKKYEENNVILSEATLTTSSDNEEFILTDPHIIAAKISIP